jgi:hypothetical protein
MKWNWHLNLDLFNFPVLFTHEIESTYWEERKLFGIPGSISAFLVINFILLLVALVGLAILLRGEYASRYFALLLAGGGLLAFCIHLVFIMKGYPEFTLPVSLIFSGIVPDCIFSARRCSSKGD